MVKLTKIYTRSGDAGTTGLGTGSRVSKADVRVEAYGSVDEANAALSLTIIEATADSRGDLAGSLTLIQNDLFDVGADLATPISPDEEPGSRLRVSKPQVERLEQLIDTHNEPLEPLNSFVLPGGSRLAASLHVARTVVRRAERDSVRLLEAEATETNPLAIMYLNRLSDLLFVLARYANDLGKSDILWVPGKSR